MNSPINLQIGSGSNSFTIYHVSRAFLRGLGGRNTQGSSILWKPQQFLQANSRKTCRNCLSSKPQKIIKMCETSPCTPTDFSRITTYCNLCMYKYCYQLLYSLCNNLPVLLLDCLQIHTHSYIPFKNDYITLYTYVYTQS